MGIPGGGEHTAFYRRSRSLVFRVEQPKTKQLKGLGTHISPAGPVGTHISRAPDGLRRYSARPRTSMTRAGGAKGGAGGEAPRQIHPYMGFRGPYTSFRRTYTSFRRPSACFRRPKIRFSSLKMTSRGRKSVLTTSKLMFGGRETRFRRQKSSKYS